MTSATFIVSFLLTLLSWQQGNGNLTVTIEGVKDSAGWVQIGIFNNAKTFPDDDGQYLFVEIKAKAPVTTYTFENLPFDEYAIAVFHDVNSDHKCNTNMIGIPTEGYGFSNNIKPFLSAPSFSKTKFEFNETSSIDITLLY